MMSDYKVEMINDGMQEFFVEFHGPKESKSWYPYLFCSFNFPSDLYVSLHKVEFLAYFSLVIVFYLFYYYG